MSNLRVISRMTTVAVAGIGLALSSVLVGAVPAQAVNSGWNCQYIYGPISGGTMNASECQGSGLGTGWIYVPGAEYRCYVTRIISAPGEILVNLNMESCIRVV